MNLTQGKVSTTGKTLPTPDHPPTTSSKRKTCQSSLSPTPNYSQEMILPMTTILLLKTKGTVPCLPPAPTSKSAEKHAARYILMQPG